MKQIKTPTFLFVVFMLVTSQLWGVEPFEPYLVKDMVLTRGSHAQIEGWEAVGEEVFFTAFSPETGIELWKSDGTEAGTVFVKDVLPGPESSQIKGMTNVNGTLFFSALQGWIPPGYERRELWKSDGTPEGTVIVRDTTPGDRISMLGGIAALGGIVIYTYAVDRMSEELWRSDGTLEGTVMVKDIAPAACGFFVTCSSSPKRFTKVGDVLYFIARQVETGHELWKTDGTEAGTVMVKDINPGGCVRVIVCASGFDGIGSEFRFTNFENIGGTIYFIADDGVHGEVLWKSDGTEAGTRPLFDGEVSPPYTISTWPPPMLTAVGEDLFFRAIYNGSIDGIWKTDGTPEGTSLVIGELTNVSELTAVGGELWFMAAPRYDYWSPAVWRTDGTAAGTVKVTEGSFSKFFPFNGKVALVHYTAADNRPNGLWVSDGSDPGTVLFLAAGINRTYPMPDDYIYTNTSFLPIGGKLFFIANDDIHGYELWSTDLTPEGTAMVRDINVTWGTNAFIGKSRAVVGRTLYFTAIRDGPPYPTVLWKTDGTEEGTVEVADFNAYRDDGTRQYLVARNLIHHGGALYFTVIHAYYATTNWSAIYKSDGTPEGTQQILLTADYIVGLQSAGPYIFYSTERFERDASGNRLRYLSLWRTDGTPAGQVELATYQGRDCRIYKFAERDYKEEFTLSGGRVFFNFCQTGEGRELWSTDGTPEGTIRVKDINPGFNSGKPNEGDPRELVDIGGTLYFRAMTQEAGIELWKSDGTEAGTVMVADLYPGQSFDYRCYCYRGNSTMPRSLTNGNGAFFFTGDSTPPWDYEINVWRSDGTPEGTGTLDFPMPWPFQQQIDFLLTESDSTYFTTRATLDLSPALWKVDETGFGTELVKEFVDARSAIWGGVGMDGTLFLSVNHNNVWWSTELWASDGTEAGTRLLQARDPQYAVAPAPKSYRVADGTLFFINNDNARGTNLWALRNWHEVGVDIKPGSDTNCINQNEHGSIPVAILGSPEFDVANINPESLSLQGTEVKMAGKSGNLLVSLADVNIDGRVDMVAHFDDTDNWISPGNGKAEISGKLTDGSSFRGWDQICVVP